MALGILGGSVNVLFLVMDFTLKLKLKKKMCEKETGLDRAFLNYYYFFLNKVYVKVIDSNGPKSRVLYMGHRPACFLELTNALYNVIFQIRVPYI